MSDEYGVADAANQFGAMSLAQRGEPPADCMIGGDSGSPINFESILVGAPIMKGSNRFNQYHAYPIQTIPSTEGIYRRYSEFEWLYTTLVAMYPGVFVPPIPPKKMFGGKDDSFIETQRRPGLERFLHRCSKIPILAESLPFQAFVTMAHSFDVSQKTVAKLLSQRRFEHYIKTYEYYYPSVLSQELPTSIDVDFVALMDFAKQKEAQLTELATISGELEATVVKQVKLLGKLTTGLSASKDLEDGFQFTPTHITKASTLDSFGTWSAELVKSEPHFGANLFTQYVQELEDVQCFIALLSERKSLRSRADKAQQRAVAWDAPGAKCVTDKQRAQRAADHQTADEDRHLSTYVDKMVWYDQFQLFWSNLVEEYNHNMIQFASSQSTYTRNLYHNFKSFNNANGVFEDE